MRRCTMQDGWKANQPPREEPGALRELQRHSFAGCAWCWFGGWPLEAWMLAPQGGFERLRPVLSMRGRARRAPQLRDSSFATQLSAPHLGFPIYSNSLRVSPPSPEFVDGAEEKPPVIQMVRCSTDWLGADPSRK